MASSNLRNHGLTPGWRPSQELRAGRERSRNGDCPAGGGRPDAPTVRQKRLHGCGHGHAKIVPHQQSAHAQGDGLPGLPGHRGYRFPACGRQAPPASRKSHKCRSTFQPCAAAWRPACQTTSSGDMTGNATPGRPSFNSR